VICIVSRLLFNVVTLAATIFLSGGPPVYIPATSVIPINDSRRGTNAVNVVIFLSIASAQGGGHPDI
jgi:hypothetical protein